MIEHDSSEACPAELPNFCAQRHWAIFWVLILCSAAVVTGRIVTVRKYMARGETAFFSANDRSRWCTIRALGDEGKFEIDDVIAGGQPIDWDTIDKVQHVGADGQMHSYSSKPPLYPWLLSWKYRGIKWMTGWTLADQPMWVTRCLLLFSNAIPWAIYLWFFAKLINSVPVRDWARYYLLACAGFGTFVSTFAISLNNHFPAAVCVMVALYFMSQIWRRANVKWWAFAAVGLFAGFAAVCELPALSFVGCAALLCAIRSPKKAILSFAPAVLLVAAAFFYSNHVAHGTWEPAYAHRGDGPVLEELESSDLATADGVAEKLNSGNPPTDEVGGAIKRLGIERPSIELGAWPATPGDVERWVVRDQVSTKQLAITRLAGSSTFQFRQWSNWYDYPSSYWLATNDEKKSQVDLGQPSAEIYTFHILFGHHGIFSLSPIWLLALAGMIALACGSKMAGRFTMRWLGLMAIALSVVVIVFYVSRPALDRNYGGVTSCLRWLLWLTPIWLASMLPIVDWLGSSKKGQALCLTLLIISAISAMYSMHNPWVHPWLYEIWDATGLPK